MRDPSYMPKESVMFLEAAYAPVAVRAALRENAQVMDLVAKAVRDFAPDMVVTLARGSSDNVATYVRYLIETKLNILSASFAPSVRTVYGAQSDMRRVLMLAISQSGRSPDLLQSLDSAKQAGALTVALVNDMSSPMAVLADMCVPLCAGAEYSVAATKSYLCSCALGLGFIAHWAGDAQMLDDLDALPAQLDDAWNADWRAGIEGLRNARNLYVVGRGLGFGAAQEIALKFKETCGLHAEAFSAAELCHGPIALAGDAFPALVLSQCDETREGVREIARTLLAGKTPVYACGCDVSGATVLSCIDAPAYVQPILFVQSAYRMIDRLARLRGYDPDAPRNLKKVTETL